jgi:hypothetical protein
MRDAGSGFASDDGEQLRQLESLGVVPDGLPLLPSESGPPGRLRPPAALEAALGPEYEVLGEIGRGGCGIVHLAMEKTAQRLVAVKVLLPGNQASHELAPRFLAEARKLGRLGHVENVVRLYRSFEREGSVYLVMEYCEGGTLADLLDRARPDEMQAAGYVETLARTMAQAHAEDVVHRDLKPGNVFLTGEGKPKIGDLGLALDLADPSRHTRTGAILGTAAYMAPEQARGEKEVGPAADVYALGAILYEMLAGRPPFVGEDVLVVLAQVKESDPRLPPGPEGLVAVCMKCLNKSPQARYRGAAELADDLARFREGKPVKASLPGVFRRVGRWSARQTRRAANLPVVRHALYVLALAWAYRALLLATLLTLAALVGGVFFAWPAIQRQFDPPSLDWPEAGTPYDVFDEQDSDFRAGGWMPHGGPGLRTEIDCRDGPRFGEVCYRAKCDLSNDPWRGDAWLLDGEWEHAKPRVDLFRKLSASRGDRIVIRFWARSPEAATVEFKGAGSGSFAPSVVLELTPEWRQYQIDLTGKDLSVGCIFLWVMDRQRNPSWRGRTFTLYLDRIRIARVERPR